MGLLLSAVIGSIVAFAGAVLLLFMVRLFTGERGQGGMVLNGLRIVAVVLIAAGIIGLTRGKFTGSATSQEIRLDVPANEPRTVDIPPRTFIATILAGALLLLVGERRSTMKITDVPAGSLFLALPASDQRPATPLSYVGQIVAMSRRHGGELAVAVGGVVAVVITALVTFSVLRGRAFGGIVHGLFVLLPPIGAVLALEAAVATWRLYRRQQIALATTRALLAMNAADREDLERHLLRRYRRREIRIEERNAARIERMAGEIAALHAAAIERPVQNIGVS